MVPNSAVTSFRGPKSVGVGRRGRCVLKGGLLMVVPSTTPRGSVPPTAVSSLCSSSLPCGGSFDVFAGPLRQMGSPLAWWTRGEARGDIASAV